LAVAQHLPQGRHQAGDRHLKIHEDPYTLVRSPRVDIDRGVSFMDTSGGAWKGP
jgi:hypothetical protein